VNDWALQPRLELTRGGFCSTRRKEVQVDDIDRFVRAVGHQQDTGDRIDKDDVGRVEPSWYADGAGIRICFIARGRPGAEHQDGNDNGEEQQGRHGSLSHHRRTLLVVNSDVYFASHSLSRILASFLLWPARAEPGALRPLWTK